ncbi:MAG: hypothetical protein UC316_03680 [Lactobacillus rogosae]|nr:hypothetical protein [Lactobacillus rogosae]
MKDIITVFLKAVLAGAVMTALLLIFSNIHLAVNGSEHTGVMSILGAVADKESVQYDSLTDVDTFQNIVSKPKLVITYTQPEVVSCNEAVSLIGCFSVTGYDEMDYTDNAVNKFPDKAYIKNVLKEDRATSVMDLYDETTGSITFEEAGVYFVTIAVRDDDNRENIMTVKMPVREEAL